MASARRSKTGNRRTSRRLFATVDDAAPRPGLAIPTRWLNNFLAYLLLPVAGVLSVSFFTCFREAAAAHDAFWITEEFYFFSLGAIVWLIAFFGGKWACGEPRPLRVYVFGHELTHALWVWLMGGRVMNFEVRRDGGHIITDKSNFLIALAPYFYPIYSIAVLVLYRLVTAFYIFPYSIPILFGLLGFTLSFHFSFTIWMIPKGQTDLTHNGRFFSWIVIFTMNVLLLSLVLIIAVPDVTFLGFGKELLRNAEEFSHWVLTTVLGDRLHRWRLPGLNQR